MTRYANILSTGRYVPEEEQTNAQFKERLAQISDKLPGVVDKFEESSGIKGRRVAPPECVTSDLAARAAEDALRKAGVRADQVDMILLGTDSPDYLTPATSVVVQHKLGASKAGTFDIGCACASFPTGLATAAGLLAANSWMNYIIVIGAYMMSRLADPNDVTSFFYSDGAGAAVVTAGPKPGFITSTFLADGQYHRHWGIYSGGVAEPATVEAVQSGRTRVKLVDRYPPEVNHEGWPRLMRELAEKGGFDLQEIDLAIYTQVRLPSIELVHTGLGLSMEKTHWVMDKWGYTGSACIPMALDDAWEQGKLKQGDLLTLVGSGVGYNQAAVALRMA